MNERWKKRFKLIRLLGWLALIGMPFLIAAFLTKDFIKTFCAVAGILLILPAFLYVYVTVIWHWKDRYRGKHSDLWGALILLETSGWMKIVYFLRHIIPDMYQSGRYRLEVEASSETPQSR